MGCKTKAKWVSAVIRVRNEGLLITVADKIDLREIRRLKLTGHGGSWIWKMEGGTKNNP